LHTDHDSRTADVEHRLPANRGHALRSAPVVRLLAVGVPLVAASVFARLVSYPVTTRNVVSPEAETLYFGRTARCVNTQRAGSLGELRGVLERWLDDPATPATRATLDLLGHSTREHHLLRLGDTPIDMLNPRVARFFRALADAQLLERLGIVAVRLLGCETAVTDSGQRTLCMLARTLRLPVFGTLVPLLRSHSNADGFNPAYAHLLVEASALR
jgi:hypothetical protein